MSDVFRPVRDDVNGTILFNGKIVGWVKSLSKTVDNSPIDYPTVDSRVINRFLGGLPVGGSIDKLNDFRIDGNLFELALGKKLIENGECLIKKGDRLTHEYSLTQLGKESEWELYLAREIAQSFYARASIPTVVQVYLKKMGVGLSSGMKIGIHNDSIDKPGSGVWSETVANADIPSDGWLKREVVGVSLTPKNKYWVLLRVEATSEGEAGVSGVTVCYNSVSDDFADGHSRVVITGDWVDLNYDIAFQLISSFTDDRGFEIVEKLTNGSKNETTTFKKVKITANTVTVEGNSLLIDSGSWNAEDVESIIS